jgi:3-oxoadipate enol-lactonase
MSPALNFIRVNDNVLHYTRAGLPNGTPLVFLNSLGTDLRIWNGITAHFAPRFPIICYDKRGHGLSDCPPGPYIIRDLSNDLHGLLDHLRVDTAILIGVSIGGMIALDFAGRQPERVKALMLCDTGAKIGTTQMWNERIDLLRQNGLVYLAETILGRWFTATFIQGQPDRYRGYYHMLTRTPLAGYIATCEAIREADLSQLVGQIRAPALVVGGLEDLATPPDLVRSLADALPNARLELIEQCGHLPSIEQPAVLAAKIDAFLSEQLHV